MIVEGLAQRIVNSNVPSDKAIDLMDEAGSQSQMQLSHAQVQLAVPVVTEIEIQQLVSTWTCIPVEEVSSEESKRLLNMEDTFQECIIGQKEAVKAVKMCNPSS